MAEASTWALVNSAVPAVPTLCGQVRRPVGASQVPYRVPGLDVLRRMEPLSVVLKR